MPVPEHRLPGQSGGGHPELHRPSEKRPRRLPEEHGGSVCLRFLPLRPCRAPRPGLSNLGCLLLHLEAGGLLRALTQFSHLAADTIINGSATAHMAPTDHADRKQRDGALASLRSTFVTPFFLGLRRNTPTFLPPPVGLTENCRGCAAQSLQYLKDLKAKATIQRADPASVRVIVQRILHLGRVSRPP